MTHKKSAMQSLIQRASLGQWDMDSINWDQKIIVPDGLELHDYIDSISQLYHAELFTIKVCTKLISQLESIDYKHFLALQIADEARHAKLYERYLSNFGEILPQIEGMGPLFESILNWPGHPLATVFAINFFLEGEAINQQNKRIQTLPCPLFKEINQMILKDESRHNAFGVIYLQENKKLLDASEFQEVLAWIRSLWLLWESNNDQRYQHESASILRNGKAELEGRWDANLKKLRGLNILPEEIIC